MNVEFGVDSIQVDITYGTTQIDFTSKDGFSFRYHPYLTKNKEGNCCRLYVTVCLTCGQVYDEVKKEVDAIKKAVKREHERYILAHEIYSAYKETEDCLGEN